MRYEAVSCAPLALGLNWSGRRKPTPCLATCKGTAAAVDGLSEEPVLYGIKIRHQPPMRSDIAGRDLRVFPDDAFIASYPRSGNTWTRFLMANLIHP